MPRMNNHPEFLSRLQFSGLMPFLVGRWSTICNWQGCFHVTGSEQDAWAPSYVLGPSSSAWRAWGLNHETPWSSDLYCQLPQESTWSRSENIWPWAVTPSNANSPSLPSFLLFCLCLLCTLYWHTPLCSVSTRIQVIQAGRGLRGHHVLKAGQTSTER